MLYIKSLTLPLKPELHSIRVNKRTSSSVASFTASVQKFDIPFERCFLLSPHLKWLQL